MIAEGVAALALAVSPIPATAERVRRSRCAQSRPTPCIWEAAQRWNVSFTMLRRKAYCESTMNPYASNGSHFGLFQFAWSTWASTPYGRRWIFSAKYNSLAAAWMHRVGRGGEWVCG